MKFTIGRKLFLGFFSLVISMGVMFFLTQNTLDRNKEVIAEITELRNPSLYAIEDLMLEIEDIRALTNQWGVVQSDPDTDDKKTLKDLLDSKLPYTRSVLDSLSEKWEESDQSALAIVSRELDSLVLMSTHVTQSLASFAAYNDPFVVMEIDFLLSNGGDFDVYSDQIIRDIEKIHAVHRGYSRDANFQMVDSFNELNRVVLWVGVPLTIIGFLIALFTVQNFTVPILKLKDLLLEMALGVNPRKISFQKRNDEIGEIARALDEHKDALDLKIKFAAQVGSGNFDKSYEPASSRDELGNALLEMSHNLNELTNNLERKVEQRTEVINTQKNEIEEKNRAIFSSISYALTIQQAILPEPDNIKALVDDFFVFYQPRDIVSGDFFWFYDLEEELPGQFLIAAIDCTGHGIPGAFMSMIAYNLLNRVAKEGIYAPDEILAKLHNYIKEALRQDDTDSKDGMDMVLFRVDQKSKTFQYSGAKNPLYYVKGDEMIKVRGTRHAIGGAQQSDDQKYDLVEVSYADSPVTIFMYSDGYQDQFGGEFKKKFLSKRFERLLLDISPKSCEQQHAILTTELEDWQGDQEQIDDILVMGMKLS